MTLLDVPELSSVLERLIGRIIKGAWNAGIDFNVVNSVLDILES